MKILYVLRHAKSDWGDSSLKDFDRPLNARGQRASMAIGKELRKRKIKPDLVLASPAVRVKETLERVQHAYGSALRISDDSRIYMAEPEQLFEMVRGVPDDVNRLLVVGHNPGLQELVIALSRPGELRDEAAEKFPTAAFAEIRFEAKSWNDVTANQGLLDCLVRPRDL